MKKLLNLLAVPLLALVVGGAGASAATMTEIDTTGPSSDAVVDVSNNNAVELENENNTGASIANDQKAKSGDSDVSYNTTGGDATTGDSASEFAVEANVEHTNASSSDFALNSGDCGCGDVETTIGNTGPKSNVEVTVENNNEVRVRNTNNFDLSVSNSQYSSTGDATVHGNTTGGDAATGDASASASVTVDHFTSN